MALETLVSPSNLLQRPAHSSPALRKQAWVRTRARGLDTAVEVGRGGIQVDPSMGGTLEMSHA